MTDPRSADGDLAASAVIRAPRQAVYNAFVDPAAVAAWLAPDGMRGHVHEFDARPGGRFRVSLVYTAPDAGQGKTSSDTDTYHGYFQELTPFETVVQVIEFESAEPGFAGTMRMTVRLADAEGGTRVSLYFDGLPSGIDPDDNAAGSRSSLRKLAALLE